MENKQYDIFIWLKGHTDQHTDEPIHISNVVSVKDTNQEIKIPDFYIDTAESYLFKFIRTGNEFADENYSYISISGSEISYIEINKARIPISDLKG